MSAPPSTAPSARRRHELSLLAISAAMPVLTRAYHAAANKAIAHVGLSQTMGWPLVMVGRHGNGLRQGVLAEYIGVEAPSLARSMDQLVEGGFIERREDAADRRARTLHLTPAGEAACAKIEAALAALRNELFAGVSQDDVAACTRVFTTLAGNLGCQLPQAPAA
ncbi:MarR family winged helix-turn-helix transcriptional regulator [Xylophilus sp.]|uniref:MarR family winged helix-turn-helix transcriptional regulator n=1 Tax=Xylophilus sp. TaxID=2653893 RepID=UPI0013B719ED|nr:MarR family transcriptional regulator [Xylophilus sp.]KAF1048994.1 MAG: Transcriptional regulator SlyA [Xylophilus sp.]